MQATSLAKDHKWVIWIEDAPQLMCGLVLVQ
jgi:hypothetical protein